MELSQAPVTRRELRLADKRIRRRQLLSIGGVCAPVPDLLRRAITLPPPAVGTAAAVVVVAVSAALMGGGTAQVYSHRVAVARNELAAAAASAAARHETANQARFTLAGGSRLEGQAAAYAASRRGAALVVARAAVAVADSVAASAVADVSPETLTALDEATASLSALIAAAPDLVDPRLADVSATATATVANDPAPAPAGAEADPAPSNDPATPPSPATPATPTTTPAIVEPAARNLELSAQMVTAAQVVTELSGQVQAAAAANVAAEVAAAATAAAVSDELARKVDAADESPNGDIAADVLCGVAFAPKALMRCDAARALEQLNGEHRADLGSDLIVSSSYRSYDAQVGVKALRGDLAAAPGSSNHGRALAVDFAGFGSVGEYTDPTYRWMKANAGRFGWSHPEYMEPGGAGPLEPWHWEFAAD